MYSAPALTNRRAATLEIKLQQPCLFLGSWEICLCERVHQQPCDAAQDELEVLVPVDPGEVVQEEIVWGRVSGALRVRLQGHYEHLMMTISMTHPCDITSG